jgi:hypothetical protein
MFGSQLVGVSFIVAFVMRWPSLVPLSLVLLVSTSVSQPSWEMQLALTPIAADVRPTTSDKPQPDTQVLVNAFDGAPTSTMGAPASSFSAAALSAPGEPGDSGRPGEPNVIAAHIRDSAEAQHGGMRTHEERNVIAMYILEAKGPGHRDAASLDRPIEGARPMHRSRPGS